MSKFSCFLEYTEDGLTLLDTVIPLKSLYLSFLVDDSLAQVHALSLSDVGTFEKFFDYGSASFGIEIDADCSIKFGTTFLDENYIYSCVSPDAYRYLLSRICSTNPTYCSSFCENGSSDNGGGTSDTFLTSLNGHFGTFKDGLRVAVNGISDTYTIQSSFLAFDNPTTRSLIPTYRLLSSDNKVLEAPHVLLSIVSEVSQ